jgi:hypothetical protein
MKGLFNAVEHRAGDFFRFPAFFPAPGKIVALLDAFT